MGSWLCCCSGIFCMYRTQNHGGQKVKEKRKYFSSVTIGINVGECHKTWVVRRPRNDSRKSRVSESTSVLYHNIICSRHCAESL